MYERQALGVFTGAPSFNFDADSFWRKKCTIGKPGAMMQNRNLAASKNLHLVAERGLAEGCQKHPQSPCDLMGRDELREALPLSPSTRASVFFQKDRVQRLVLGHPAKFPGFPAVEPVVKVPATQPLHRELEAHAARARALQPRERGVGLRVTQEAHGLPRQHAARQRGEGVGAVAHDPLTLSHDVDVLVVADEYVPHWRQ
mmetsp:Transcript_42170/g.117413  ORF Transcript_42170/g.117413 Transcript_42170/m.117413 type:complete len:201 (-) Transcript_42170:286-888(-)